MAYVTPASTIKIYKGIPWDNTYSHTVAFATRSTQASWMDGYLDKTFTNYTYQRKEENKIRVECLADDLYSDNYLSFQNRSGKIFYCFITGIEYISENCTEITFEIDVFQTYLENVDYKFNPCYVVRMHSTSDAIGDNIQAEPLETGEYMYSNEQGLLSTSDVTLCIVVMICDVDGGSSGVLFNGCYSGAQMYCYSLENWQAVDNLLNEYTEKPESIVAMYVAPAACFSSIPNGPVSQSSAPIIADYNLTALYCSGNEDFDGYVPKNKKLYTYPFNACVINNRMGSELQLRFEFWTNRIPQFRTRAIAIPPTEITVLPLNYAGDSGDCWQQSLTIGNYPQCSWNNDAWATYMGNGGLASDIISGVGGVASGITSAVMSGLSPTGNPIGGILSAVSSAASTVNNIHSAKIAADSCHGSASAGSINACARENNFSVYRQHITADYAKMIDDYFTVYGYAQNKITQPNTRIRPCWTYIQTSGCSLSTLEGNPPASAMSTIRAAMDRGMTFWQSGATVGDYSQDNSL